MRKKLEEPLMMVGFGASAGLGAIIQDLIETYYPGTQGDGTILIPPWNNNKIIIPLVGGGIATIAGLLMKSKQKLLKLGLITFGFAAMTRAIYSGFTSTTAARARAFSSRLAPQRMGLNRRTPVPPRAMQKPTVGRVIRGRLASNGSAVRPSKFQSTATGLSSDTIVA